MRRRTVEERVWPRHAGVTPAVPAPGVEVPPELLDAAVASPPARPWGHLVRFPALEARLGAFASRLRAASAGRPSSLSLRAAFDADGLPERVLALAEPSRFPMPEGEDADATAAICGAAALAWAAMTDVAPASMHGWIAVTEGADAARKPHFDLDAGSVVITLDGTTTWVVEPATRAAVAAVRGVPFCVPGKTRAGAGGLLHGVREEPGRVVAVFRAGSGRPSSRSASLAFDPEACATLLGSDRRPMQAPRP